MEELKKLLEDLLNETLIQAVLISRLLGYDQMSEMDGVKCTPENSYFFLIHILLIHVLLIHAMPLTLKTAYGKRMARSGKYDLGILFKRFIEHEFPSDHHDHL